MYTMLLTLTYQKSVQIQACSTSNQLKDSLQGPLDLVDICIYDSYKTIKSKKYTFNEWKYIFLYEEHLI